MAEIDSRPVAELVDARHDDMFWESYAVEGLGEFRDQVEEDEFWNREIVFRSKSFPEFTVTGCIARWRAGEGRLLVRSLYIHGVELNVFERIMFAIWRRL